MPDDAKTDEELLRRLTDPANPRTPLHFKLLDHQQAQGTSFFAGNASCVFHRTVGYACGISAASPKPISKLFGDRDGE